MRTVDERTSSLGSVLKELSDSIGAEIRVSMPGTIQKWDSATQTAQVQLSIREKIIKEGAETDVAIPVLVDVPVVMPRAGGFMVGLTPAQGDEVLVCFADLCIDAWWQSGGLQNQDEVRRHDFSDAFAIFGTWNQKRKPSLPSSGIRIQSVDASTYVHVTSGKVEIKAASIALIGSATLNGQAIATEE